MSSARTKLHIILLVLVFRSGQTTCASFSFYQLSAAVLYQVVAQSDRMLKERYHPVPEFFLILPRVEIRRLFCYVINLGKEVEKCREENNLVVRSEELTRGA